MADGKQFIDPDTEELSQFRQQHDVRTGGPFFQFAEHLAGDTQVFCEIFRTDSVFGTQPSDDAANRYIHRCFLLDVLPAGISPEAYFITRG